MSKIKKVLKRVGLVAVGVGAIGAVGFGIKSSVDYFKNDTKTLHLDYEVGNLGNDGKYVSDKCALYTKEAFACKGNKFKLSFNSEINYQAFYYDDLDNFVGKTEVLTTSEAPAVPYNADKARLVITPTNDEDGKISFTEKYKYSSQIDVSVLKNQTSKVKGTTYLDGKRIYVVDDTSILNFKYGALSTSDGFTEDKNDLCNNFIEFDNQILQIDKGMKIELNNDFSSKENWYVNVYEISELPPTLDTLINGAYHRVVKGESYEFTSATKYILLEFGSDSTGSSYEEKTPWTSDELNNIINSFTITKA